MTRPLRIGHQLSGRTNGDVVAAAVRAEELGFDVVLVGDHVGPGSAPMPTLAAIATATERIRLGTGHTPSEYTATGIAHTDAATRKRRLASSVEIIRRLLDGALVDRHDEFYDLERASIDRPVQGRLPILVGGNGERLLAHAGAHADIVGLQGLGRTRPDGHRHAVDWSSAKLDGQLDQIRAGAGDRSDDLELNALVQMVQITDDRDAALTRICDMVDGLTLDDARETPYLLVGTVDEVVLHLMTCRERWGISYFAVRELDDFAPVLEALDR